MADTAGRALTAPKMLDCNKGLQGYLSQLRRRQYLWKLKQFTCLSKACPWQHAVNNKLVGRWHALIGCYMADTAGQWHALIGCHMADTAGQWHALIVFVYGRHRRPMVRDAL